MISPPINEAPAFVTSGDHDPAFVGLCDGVLSGLAELNASIHDLLHVKTLLIESFVPANVKAHVTLGFGRLQRAAVDLQSPLGELVRFVRLFNQPWTAKSGVLEKILEHYNRQKSDLEITLHQHQVAEAMCTKLKQDRLVLLWERLFLRLQRLTHHAPRWQYLLSTFRQRAQPSTDAPNRMIVRDPEEDDDGDLLDEVGRSVPRLPTKPSSAYQPPVRNRGGPATGPAAANARGPQASRTYTGLTLKSGSVCFGLLTAN